MSIRDFIARTAVDPASDHSVQRLYDNMTGGKGGQMSFRAGMEDDFNGRVMDHLRGKSNSVPEVITNKSDHVLSAKASPMGQAVYLPGKDKSLAFSAHELGHITGLGGKRNPYTFAHAGARAMSTGGLPLSFIANLRSGYNQATGEDDGALTNTGVWGNRLAQAGVLGEEARASVRGVRAIDKVYGRAKALRAIKPLALAFSTYGAQAGLSEALPRGIGYGFGKLFRKKKDAELIA